MFILTEAEKHPGTYNYITTTDPTNNEGSPISIAQVSYIIRQVLMFPYFHKSKPKAHLKACTRCSGDAIDPR